MILGELAELALRATGLGCAVWLCLKLASVRDPRLLMTVWSLVLLVAIAMPALEPWMQVRLPAGLLPARTRPVLAALPSRGDGSPADLSALPVAAPAPAGQVSATAQENGATRRQAPDWRWWATTIYLVVAGGMMLRLLLGIAVMCRVTAAARPVHDSVSRPGKVRITAVVRVPVTFAWFILLPASSVNWSDRKRRIVLLHEGVHVARGDFFRLLLASLYRAAFWFSPFAWWLQHCLADLAEMISDDAVLARTGDARGYADILLDMADAAPRALPGLAMADADSVPRRVRRMLTPNPSPATTRRGHVMAAIAMLPLSSFSVASITVESGPRLEAPQHPIDMSPALANRLVGDYQIGVGSLLTIMRDGSTLHARLIGEPELRLIAVSGHDFISDPPGEKLSFATDTDGPVDSIELRSGAGRTIRARRIDSALAQQIRRRFIQRVASAPDRFVRQLPIAGGDDRLRQIIEALRRQGSDYGPISPQLAGQMPSRAPRLHAALSLLGEVRAIAFHGVGPGGYDVYELSFANGSAEFRIDVAEDGTVSDVIFRPEGDGREGGIVDCKAGPGLKYSTEIAPIRISLLNRSGAVVRLSQLDGSGRWLASGTLEDGLSRDILTDVARPLMIADAHGQCREIVQPGRSTREHLIAPAAASDSTAAPRELPAQGSYDALQDYIAGVRSGELKPHLLTPEAAAEATPLMQQQQAILRRLGPELAISFRGVTGAGRDSYHIRYANGAADWQIAVTSQGQIASLALLP